MNQEKLNQLRRTRRKNHTRNKLRGDAARPRLCVFRSHKNIGCQVIDDEAGKTLASVNSNEKAVRDQVKYGGNCDAAAAIGKMIAERAKAAGIETVRFDRGPYKYHGRIQALAEAAREAGLKF